MGVLALLGEDAGLQGLQYHSICALNLPICAGLCDFCSVYPDIVVIAEIQDLLPSELGAIVGDYRVGDPKAEDNVLDKAHCLFGANFSQGPSFDPLSEFVNRDEQVSHTHRCFHEGSQEVQPHTVKGHVMRMVCVISGFYTKIKYSSYV
jgi:hypothetical protein